MTNNKFVNSNINCNNWILCIWYWWAVKSNVLQWTAYNRN